MQAICSSPQKIELLYTGLLGQIKEALIFVNGRPLTATILDDTLLLSSPVRSKDILFIKCLGEVKNSPLTRVVMLSFPSSTRAYSNLDKFISPDSADIRLRGSLPELPVMDSTVLSPWDSRPNTFSFSGVWVTEASEIPTPTYARLFFDGSQSCIHKDANLVPPGRAGEVITLSVSYCAASSVTTTLSLIVTDNTTGVTQTFSTSALGTDSWALLYISHTLTTLSSVGLQISTDSKETKLRDVSCSTSLRGSLFKNTIPLNWVTSGCCVGGHDLSGQQAFASWVAIKKQPESSLTLLLGDNYLSLGEL